MFKAIIYLFLLNIFFVTGYIHLDWDPSNPAFDSSFYEDVLDSELCQEQLAYIRNDTFLSLQFIESGLKIPKGILTGNTVDLGNYYQCLDIQDVGSTNIEGKYCLINVPLDQDLQFPQLPGIPGIPEWVPELPEWIDFDPRNLKIEERTAQKLRVSKEIDRAMQGVTGASSRSVAGTQLENLAFTLAVCIPKTCTTQEGINGLLFNLTAFGFKYEDSSCRLNNDKPWAPADYVATVVFSVLGLITLLSTSYDVWHSFILKSDPKSVTALYRTFSLYTNARRLTTFTTNPGALECVDGIRALSMMWVILGHTFSTLPPRVNFLYSIEWTLSLDSIWVIAAPISVDTFFMLSGMLLVYTTSGKMTGMKLIKNLHLFYLNRILRMFPLLAAGVLVQASFLYRLSDGPLWTSPAMFTDRCRSYWWTTLLYIQNYANVAEMCLPHTWYLAIDMHLYILSPLILFWVLSGNKSAAWISMASGLISFLIASTVYIFIKEFPGSVIAPARNDENLYYMHYYYLNTLTRAAPFFVGMMFGYLLHLCRGKKLKLSWISIACLWFSAFFLMGLGAYAHHPMKDVNWDNQTVDSLVNAYSRLIWAVGVGIVIFSCVQGYGGPVNWFLSLHIWKLPSRLSYGMYIFHYPIMYVTAGTALQPIFFTPVAGIYRFFSEFSIAVLVSFAMTLFVDSPFSTIFKNMMGGGPRRPQNQRENEPKNGIATGGGQNLQNNGYPRNKYNVKL